MIMIHCPVDRIEHSLSCCLAVMVSWRVGVFVIALLLCCSVVVLCIYACAYVCMYVFLYIYIFRYAILLKVQGRKYKTPQQINCHVMHCIMKV